MNIEKPDKNRSSAIGKARFVAYSVIGIIVFFLPVHIAGQTNIPLGHITDGLEALSPDGARAYALVLLVIGALFPWVTGGARSTRLEYIFSILKLVGLIAACLIFFNLGPEWLLTQDVGGFLFGTLVVTVAIVVPIGSAFLALLVEYGLLEFVGVLLRPVMRVVWKVPGRAAVDAIASFVASFFIGLLITDRLYKEGKYTTKEAAIIATGFSTVTVAFMLVIAQTLNLMQFWNTYFWTTLLVTVAVTAVTVRIWPLCTLPDSLFGEAESAEAEDERISLKVAWRSGVETSRLAEPVWILVWKNFRDGLYMTMSITPLIMSVGAAGLLVATYTPLFEWFGYVFFPLTALLHIPEPFVAAQSLAIEVTEMFLPSLLVVDAPVITKFIIAVESVSAIVFFSAYIPAVFSTSIPLTLPKLLVIWIERTVLSVLITTPIAIWIFS